MLLIINYFLSYFFPSSMITIFRNHFLPTFMWQLPRIVTQPEANQKTKKKPNLHPKKIVRLHKLRVGWALQKTLPKKQVATISAYFDTSRHGGFTTMNVSKPVSTSTSSKLVRKQFSSTESSASKRSKTYATFSIDHG